MTAKNAREGIEREIDTRTRPRYRVSAIVSTYASAAYLRGCIDDLVTQTLYGRGELEIIVIDSASPENEWSILSELARRLPNLRAVRTRERESLYASWNRAILEARGEFLTNANADDRHRPDAFKLMVAALDAHPDVSLVYGNSYYSTTPNETWANNPRDRRFLTQRYFAPSLLLYFFFGPQPMWRREIHDRVGLFNPDYRAAGDWEFALRFARRERALHIEDELGLYLVHEGAISHRDGTMARENRRILETFHTPEMVESLYAGEGVSPDSPEQRARIHADMGQRALGYPCPDGVTRRRPEFALACFERAAALAPGWVAPLNNAAAALALLGAVDDAAKLFESLAAKVNLPEVRRNLALLRGRRGVNLNGSLRLLPSGLNLPSQQELIHAPHRTEHTTLPLPAVQPEGRAANRPSAERQASPVMIPRISRDPEIEERRDAAETTLR